MTWQLWGGGQEGTWEERGSGKYLLGLAVGGAGGTA